MFDAKRFRPKVRFGIKKRRTLATNRSRNRQRPCPTGAFYGQEAVFIEVRARSDPSPSGAAVRVKKRVNGYENRCKAMGFQLYALQKDSGF
jgi:hypothetical protein